MKHLPEEGIKVLVTTESGHEFKAKRIPSGGKLWWVTATREDEQLCPYNWPSGICRDYSSPVIAWKAIGWP